LLQLTAVVNGEIAFDPQALIEFREHTVLQVSDEDEAVVGLRALDINDDLSEIRCRDYRMRRARADEALAWVVAVCVALILNDDPRKKACLAVLSDQVELHAAPPKHARVDVEGANDRTHSLGGITEQRRREQAVVRRQQLFGRLSISDLKGEEHTVRFDDKAHVRVAARPSFNDVPLESERQLAEETTTLGRGRNLGRHDQLLGRLDITSKILGSHVISSLCHYSI